MEKIFDFIQEQLLSDFDFGFTLVVNIATYLVILMFTTINLGTPVKIWWKRLILVAVIIVIVTAYKLCGYENNIRLVNSAILSPVAWSWIFKPLCNHLGIDYKNIDKLI